MATVKCIMCGRPARKLAGVQDRVGSTDEPVFCTRECAARWACIHVGNERHLCPATGQWEFDPFDCDECRDCAGCRESRKEKPHA